jgi:hypothetical protein
MPLTRVLLFMGIVVALNLEMMLYNNNLLLLIIEIIAVTELVIFLVM